MLPKVDQSCLGVCTKKNIGARKVRSCPVAMSLAVSASAVSFKPRHACTAVYASSDVAKGGKEGDVPPHFPHHNVYILVN